MLSGFELYARWVPLTAVALKSLNQWKIIKLFPPKVVAVA